VALRAGIAALGYVGVQSPRAAEWQTFGPEVLGMPLAPATGDAVIRLRMDERAYRLAIHPAEADALAYVGWELPGAAELDEAFAALERAGANPRRGTPDEAAARQVTDLVHVEDPAGNHLELFHGAASGGAFAPARPISGFKTGPLGLGHLVIGVGQAIDACRAFYLDVLGFRLSDAFESSFLRMVFMRVNPRHHSLALGTQKVGLHHIMIETNSIDDVGSTFDLCKARQVPLARALGRHSNDLMFSFYMETPSGFDVEYGWNGRLIDEAAWEPVVLSSTSLWGHEFLGERAKMMAALRQRAAATPPGSPSPAG
jgi:extradiol dioxygenase